PQLALGEARAGALEVGRQIALETLLGKRSGVAEQAQPDSSIRHDGAAADGIALRFGERLRQRILRVGDADQEAGRDDRGRKLHPNTSDVIVRNHASASTASAARALRGASAGLTPPDPGTSASRPPVGW